VALLDTWDQAIDQAERLIAAKMRRYRGLLSRYSAQFHDERIELGEIAYLVGNRIQPGSSDTPKTSIELENIETETGRFLGSEKVDVESALRSRFEAGDTLFGKLRPYLRKFARPNFEGICSTEIWVLRANPKRLDPALLFYLVQTPEFDAAATKQSGSRMPRADWDLVVTTPIPCPRDLIRQSELAAQLSAALDAAQSELLKVDALRTQKRALMQRLLTGKWPLDKRFDLLGPTPQPALAGGTA
jgi:type I restriction enzyme S subunit